MVIGIICSSEPNIMLSGQNAGKTEAFEVLAKDLKERKTEREKRDKRERKRRDRKR